MLWSVIQIFIGKFADIFYSKTCKYNISGVFNEFWSFPGILLCLIGALIMGHFSVILASPIDYILILASNSTRLLRLNINKIVYEREKISAIIPFQNVNKVITVFLGILILGEEMSVVSIVLFVIVFFVIMLSSMDFKSLKFSKTILLYILGRCISSASDIIIGYILVRNLPVSYFITDIFIGFTFVIVFCFITGQFKNMKELDKDFYKNRTISSLGRIGSLISAMMIKELGLSITVILSFLGIGIALIMGYIMLRDIPTKKDIVVTIIVTILVGLGFILA